MSREKIKVFHSFHWKALLFVKRIRSVFPLQEPFLLDSSVSGQSRFRFCTVEIVFREVLKYFLCGKSLKKKK